MEQTLNQYGDVVGKQLIDSSAFGYSFTKPICWASGTYNPCYVDNRLLQSSVEARQALRLGLSSLVSDPKSIDFVFAIPSAGIAPATLLALELKKNLLIKHEGVYYSIDIEEARRLVKNHITDFIHSMDVIAGTIPFGIVFGIILAEELQKPFIFVRPKPKDHGHKKQIEGLFSKNDSIALVEIISPFCESYITEALAAFDASEIRAKFVKPLEMSAGELLQPIMNFSMGPRILGQEDLVSTGGSSVDELILLRNEGALVEIQSIFSYELPSARENFHKNDLKFKSLVKFPNLLEQLKEMGKLPVGDETQLRYWWNDQPNWGNKNGFPSVKK